MERPRSPGIVFCIFDSSAGSCIEHQSLFDTSDISLGGFDHIRVDGYVVDTALDEEFSEVWVYGRSLAADGDSLAVFVCGLDQVADSSLDREVSSSKRAETVSLFLSQPSTSMVRSLEPME